ncbi:prepilin peptidase [Streptomyces sp. t39]|uniref:prepilin peptidase n=1 Tax=Streptomyces sp. t39 TaxID=1828156 RepID=UPI0011CE41DE|nr:A24 family peptidase [Streptomyces sp. t39]TXS56693.1 prepilin peptidase [Streptomyces sp. t39]
MDVTPIAVAAAVWGAATGLLVPRAAYRLSVEPEEEWRAVCPRGHAITGPAAGWVGLARCAPCAAGAPATTADAPGSGPHAVADARPPAPGGDRPAAVPAAGTPAASSGAPGTASGAPGPPEVSDAPATGTATAADVTAPATGTAADASATVTDTLATDTDTLATDPPATRAPAVPAAAPDAPGPPGEPDGRPVPYRVSVPVSAVTAVACLLLAYATGPRPELAVWLLGAPFAVLLALVDRNVHRLPDELTLPLAGASAVLLGAAALLPGDGGSWPTALLGGLALGGVYFLLFLINPNGMGFGDVKLALSLGVVLGWYGWTVLFAGAFAGFLLGSVYGVGLMLLRRADRRTAIPFGPFMITGAFLGLLLGALAAA